MIFERIPLEINGYHAYMDAYIMDRPGAFDGMLVIPGGGYYGVCSDREGEPIAMTFQAHGRNCFVLHYSVRSETDAVFPQQLIEASLAMQYIRNHAEKFHINSNRVFVVGFSAGGHLAGSLGTLWHLPEVTAAIGDASGVNRPTGMLLCYAVLTAIAPDAHEGSIYNLFGTEHPTDTQRALAALEQHVDDRTAPAFLMHTVADRTVPVQNALRMAGALTAAGVPYELHIYPNGPHGVALSNFITSGGNPELADPAVALWVDHAVYWMDHLA